MVELQRLVDGERWVTIKTKKATTAGTVKLAYDPGKLSPRYRLRLAVAGMASDADHRPNARHPLAAFGDANFGDGVATVMDVRGALWPWPGVAPTLRARGLAFGNLECAISNRGAPVPKQFHFRGGPTACARSSGSRASTS